MVTKVSVQLHLGWGGGGGGGDIFNLFATVRSKNKVLPFSIKKVEKTDAILGNFTLFEAKRTKNGSKRNSYLRICIILLTFPGWV
jgi:hypothetical protein